MLLYCYRYRFMLFYFFHFNACGLGWLRRSELVYTVH